jgi:hypothetical protein
MFACLSAEVLKGTPTRSLGQVRWNCAFTSPDIPRTQSCHWLNTDMTFREQSSAKTVNAYITRSRC